MKYALIGSLFILFSCSQAPKNAPGEPNENSRQDSPYLLVLGNVQDAGSPQAGCIKVCCRDLWNHPDSSRMVSSLAFVNPTTDNLVVFDATPDFSRQLLLANTANHHPLNLKGIFLTHAHIGHYTGLMYLGKEAWNTKEVPVYCMPRMFSFLQNEAPWEALEKNHNIDLIEMMALNGESPDSNLMVFPIPVPHRDEYSETVAYIIQSGDKKALFLPDIDKWEKWELNIDSLIHQVDYAFLDGTFFDGNEVPNRAIKTIPHPFISESLERFSHLDSVNRNKVWFIHLNHTNPALNPKSDASKKIQAAGMHVARTGDIFNFD
ncbi:MAG: MBL fold metallo-hydrolase [Bacteroidetes bacterium]|nr:MBL fold metallo-hydrolase [Bacteroidota bacterium]